MGVLGLGCWVALGLVQYLNALGFYMVKGFSRLCLVGLVNFNLSLQPMIQPPDWFWCSNFVVPVPKITTATFTLGCTEQSYLGPTICRISLGAGEHCHGRSGAL